MFVHQGNVEWQHHEHVSEQAQLQARKLIDEAGMPALAKKAIDLADDRREARPLGMDEFARSLGFASYLALFEASTPVAAQDGQHWCLTPLPKREWIVWNDRDLQRSPPFHSKAEAMASVPQ